MEAGSQDFIVSPYLVSAPEPEAGSGAGRGMFYDLLLRRRVMTSHEDKLRLERWRREPEELRAFAGLEPGRFQLLVSRGLLLPEAEAFRQHGYTCVEIEINRHCNFRCAFCPVEAAPKPKAFMTPELYALVLDRVQEYGAPLISLNHYSEPTLDPLLIERLRLAAERGLRVRLHTNASLLDEGKVRAIAELGNTSLVINLPTADKAEYERITRTKLFDRVITNLKLIHQYGVPAQLSINTPRDSADAEVQRINGMFAALFGESVAWPTDNRAGRVEKEQYAQAVQHTGLLGGCRYVINQINVAHDGRVFLCCQDFEQEYVLGDLRQSSLSEIARSERAVQLRRWIFGASEPPAGFICSSCSWTCSLGKEPGALPVGAPAERLSRENSLMEAWPLEWAVEDMAA